jgi:hypothetical protein
MVSGIGIARRPRLYSVTPYWTIFFFIPFFIIDVFAAYFIAGRLIGTSVTQKKILPESAHRLGSATSEPCSKKCS